MLPKVMKPSFRSALADSHVAAVAIAVLLIGALDGIVQGLAQPIYRATSFLVTAIAILDIPYISGNLNSAEMLITGYYLFSTLVALAAAFSLSHWVYGSGPFRVFTAYCRRLTNRNYV